MREKKPIEEVLFAVFEVVLTVTIIVIFLVVLVTHGKVVALINLLLIFGILMNVLAGVYSIYKGNKILAGITFILAAACLIVILL